MPKASVKVELPNTVDAATAASTTVSLPPPAPLPVTTATIGPISSSNLTRPDFTRAIWVDAVGTALKSPENIKKLVADVRAAGFDTIYAQVRAQGDALYNTTLAPRAKGLPAGFDPLKTLLDEAHAGDKPIKVHALLVMFRVWSGKQDGIPENHIAKQHADWLTLAEDGSKEMGNELWLDPGVIAVQDHLALVATDLVKNYPVDGVQLDRVRYPELDKKRYPDGRLKVGYNKSAVDRYNQAISKSGQPAATNSDWVKWRRDQVTETVRKVREAVRGVRPEAVFSAGAITFGVAPTSKAEYLAKSDTYNTVLQDWLGWAENGLLDVNVLMNFKLADSRSNEFEGWQKFALENKGKAKVVVGVGGWLNPPAHTVAMMLQPVFSPTADGVALYGYSDTYKDTADDGNFSLLKPALDQAALEAKASIVAELFARQIPANKNAELLARFNEVATQLGMKPPTVTVASAAVPAAPAAGAAITPVTNLPPLAAASTPVMPPVSSLPPVIGGTATEGATGLPSLSSASTAGTDTGLPSLPGTSGASQPAAAPGLPPLASASTEAGSTGLPALPGASSSSGATGLPALPGTGSAAPSTAASTLPAPAQPASAVSSGLPSLAGARDASGSAAPGIPALSEAAQGTGMPELPSKPSTGMPQLPTAGASTGLPSLNQASAPAGLPSLSNALPSLSGTPAASASATDTGLPPLPGQIPPLATPGSINMPGLNAATMPTPDSAFASLPPLGAAVGTDSVAVPSVTPEGAPVVPALPPLNAPITPGDPVAPVMPELPPLAAPGTTTIGSADVTVSVQPPFGTPSTSFAPLPAGPPTTTLSVPDIDARTTVDTGSVNIPLGASTNYDGRAIAGPTPFAPQITPPSVMGPARADSTAAPVPIGRQTVMSAPNLPRMDFSERESAYATPNPPHEIRNYTTANIRKEKQDIVAMPVNTAPLEVIVMSNGKEFAGRVLQRGPVWRIQLPDGSVMSLPGSRIASVRSVTSTAPGYAPVPVPL